MLFTPIKIYFYLDPLLLLKVLAELILDERLDFDVPGLPPLSSANLTVDEAPDLGLAPVPGRLLDSIFRFFSMATSKHHDWSSPFDNEPPAATAPRKVSTT